MPIGLGPLPLMKCMGTFFIPFAKKIWKISIYIHNRADYQQYLQIAVY